MGEVFERDEKLSTSISERAVQQSLAADGAIAFFSTTLFPSA